MALPIKKEKHSMPIISDRLNTTSRGCVVHLRSDRPDVSKAVIGAALPLLGVGAAMASSAWLPVDNPTIGFAVLGAEIFLGAVAVGRLLSFVKN